MLSPGEKVPSFRNGERIKEKNRSGEQGERLGSEPPSTEYDLTTLFFRESP